MGIQSLGTVRPNRLPGCSLISDKEMKRQGRGTVEERVTSVEGVKTEIRSQMQLQFLSKK
jgi:hypothetical protein